MAKDTIDFSKTTTIECSSCQGKTFKQTTLLRRMSAIASPTGEETIIPILVFACEHCGHVNSEFLNLEGGLTT